MRKSYKNARVTPSEIKETKISRSEGNWGDHPHYPKNWLVPPLFFPKNIDFVIFVQFFTIFPKLSFHESTPFGKPCYMYLFYLKQVFLNIITVLQYLFQILSCWLFQLFLSNRSFPTRVYIQDICTCIGHICF